MPPSTQLHLCAACQEAHARKRGTGSDTSQRVPDHIGNVRGSKLRPGDVVSMDYSSSPVPGRLSWKRGRERERRLRLTRHPHSSIKRTKSFQNCPKCSSSPINSNNPYLLNCTECPSSFISHSLFHITNIASEGKCDDRFPRLTYGRSDVHIRTTDRRTHSNIPFEVSSF